VSVNSIGPRWGEEITRAAIRALIFFFIAIAIYISIRFEWRMAVAALAAVVHDVLISVGIYSVFGFTVSPATVIAFLTILGFSLYDTIVVFDKVHENTRRFVTAGKTPYGDIVNLSMNQVLMRSINTSLAAVLPVLSLLVVGSWLLGAIALQDFALALLVGLLTGSYSSIFIATPVLAMLKTHQDQWAKIAERSGRTRSASLAHLREDQRATAVLRPTATSTAAASADPTIPARPRKKKR
jgi:preprotein translocase subunit SecF